MRKLRWPLMAVLFATLTACATNYDWGPRGSGWGHMMYYGFGGGVMWILFIIVIGILIYFVAQNAKGRGSAGSVPETPLDILKKRYARGELTKDEFERMKKDLSE